MARTHEGPGGAKLRFGAAPARRCAGALRLSISGGGDSGGHNGQKYFRTHGNERNEAEEASKRSLRETRMGGKRRITTTHSPPLPCTA